MITPEQCKAARLLLGWSIKDLSYKARATVETIELFERSSSGSQKRTACKLKGAFEATEIMFFTDDEGPPMVRLCKDERS